MQAIPQAATEHAPSRFQQAIYDWIDGQELNYDLARGPTSPARAAVVEAVAGSGKTSTVKRAIARIPRGRSVAYVCFNTSIRDEMREEVKRAGLKHCRVTTLNGLGMSCWSAAMGLGQSDDLVDRDKTLRVLQWLVDPARSAPAAWGAPLQEIVAKRRPLGIPLGAVVKLVALMKHHVIVPPLLDGRTLRGMGTCRGHRPATDEALYALADRFDVMLMPQDGSSDASEADALELARDALVLSIIKGKQLLDYDDQIYLPVIFQVKARAFDWIFVDEAQDVSHVNRALLHRVTHGRTRVVAVGDAAQAIYGFRGAAADSLALIREEFRAVSLPLSITYRCSQAVVAEAQKLVPHIEARPGAPEGAVLHLASYTPERFKPGKSLVLCRNVSPLVGFAYKLMAVKVPVRVLGRDIGKNLISFIWGLRPTSCVDLLVKAREWMEEQQEMILKAGRRRGGGQKNEAALQAIADRFETIQILCKETGARTVEEVEQQILGLFGDEGEGRVLLATIHKAKGLEAEEAYLLEPDLLPSPWARQPWQQEQERNLLYVAITRGKTMWATITRRGLRIEKPRAVA